MEYGLVLAAVLIVLSGFIAYAGDLLGRKLGKKRLTFGRLRPRHTAALMTGLFGSLATLVAIIVIAATSEPIRVMLLQSEQTRKDKVRLETEVAALREAEAAVTEDLAEKDRLLADTESSLASAETELDTAKAELTAATNETQAVRAQRDELQNQLGSLTAQLQDTENKLDAVQAEIESLDEQNAELAAENETLEGDNALLLRNNEEYADQIQQKEKAVAETEATIAKTEERLQALEIDVEEKEGEIAELEETIALLEQEADDNVKELGDARQQLLAARTQLQDTRADLVEAQEELAALRQLDSAHLVARTLPPVFLIGDELARVPLRASLTQAEMRTYVLALLNSAEDYVEESYNQLGADQPVDVGLIERIDRRDEAQRIITPEMQIQAVIESLSNRPEEQVLIARTVFNAFPGEIVPMEIVSLSNPVIYRQGDTVIEMQIDGSGNHQQIVEEIQSFVQTNLSRRAVEDGMIPIKGREASLGEIPSEDLRDLIDQIDNANRTVRLQFVASKETRAADRIDLTLRAR